MGKDDERTPGRIVRTLRTAWLGGRVGTSYLGGRIADAFRGDAAKNEAAKERDDRNAQRIVDTLMHLRGPLMKVGQILSTHAEALPEEMSSRLSALQQDATAMSFATIKEVLEEDLGDPPEKLFRDFGEEAVAAASLGQVHRATLPDGTDVAVKVQYPGAVDSVDGDISNFHLAAKVVKSVFADALRQERWDMTPVAEELAMHLQQETDYCREAYNAQMLLRLFGDDDPYVRIPHVHLSHSGLRVVTYDWFEGEPLDAGLEASDRATRERTVRQLNHAFWHQMFRGGLLHADPHPGNFKILPDGRLGVLDYGCVKIFDESFLRAFSKMMFASLAGDQAVLRESFDDLGLMDDPESDEEFEDMQKMAGYFSVGMRSDETFDFGDFDYVQAARDLAQHFLTRRRPPPAQRDFIFLTRVVLGYYEYFSRAKANVNFHAQVMPYVEGGFRERAIRIDPYEP